MFTYLNAVLVRFENSIPIKTAAEIKGRHPAPSQLLRTLRRDDDDARRACSLLDNEALPSGKLRRAYLSAERVGFGGWMATLEFVYTAKREQRLWLYLSEAGVLQMSREVWVNRKLTDQKSIRPIDSDRVNDFTARFHEALNILSYHGTSDG